MTKLNWLLLLAAVVAALFVLWHLLPDDVKSQLGNTPMRKSNAEQYVEKELE